MACDRAIVIELLLTWSEVEAHRDLCRFCYHRRQQKPWRARSCSSIFLPLRGNSTNGETPYEALLRWPTKTNKSGRALGSTLRRSPTYQWQESRRRRDHGALASSSPGTADASPSRRYGRRNIHSVIRPAGPL